jgi:hypothetical protein
MASYADLMADYIHKARLKADSVSTPGNVLSSLMPFMGGPAGAAINGSTNGDILNDPRLMDKIKQNFAQSQPAQPQSSHLLKPWAPSPLGLTPNQRVSQGFEDVKQGPTPLQTAMATPTSFPQPPQPDAPQAPPPAAPPANPEPNPYANVPADYGQAKNIPVGSNYLMPAFGPSTDAKPSGPDVIAKLLQYFHTKDA